MARIPQEEIERIKREVSIERLAVAQGIVLKPHGKDLIGLCIWHNDTSPSLVISPDKNLFRCLGACQNVGGSVIDWVMKTRGVSFLHAIEILRSDDLPIGPARAVKCTRVPQLPVPVQFDADDRLRVKQVITFYHQTLKKSPEALDYLASRTLTSAEVIDRYQIGYCNRTLGLRLPHRTRKDGAQIRERLEKVGILRKSGHEHFRGCITLAATDENGDIVEIYGRKATEIPGPGVPKHMYLPSENRLGGSHRGVFNRAALERYEEIILCESLIDALTFLSAGFPNVTASYGVNGFTDDHREAFRRFKTKRVLIAYDRDQAGDGAAEPLAAELMAAGIECFRILFPKGMDANTYARKVQPVTKSLGLVIRKAVWMGKGPAPKRRDDEPIVEVSPSEYPPLALVAAEPVAEESTRTMDLL
jgi:DNA primase catalytic core